MALTKGWGRKAPWSHKECLLFLSNSIMLGSRKLPAKRAQEFCEWNQRLSRVERFSGLDMRLECTLR
jgi:hypothetical protein